MLLFLWPLSSKKLYGSWFSKSKVSNNILIVGQYIYEQVFIFTSHCLSLSENENFGNILTRLYV